MDQTGNMQHLVVLHIIAGKFFPAQHSIFAECCFGGTTQRTEAISSPSPFWNHEFKWSLSKQKLSLFRSERVPIKVTFHSEDSRSSKHNMGYLIFSLRYDVNREQELWHPLLQPPALLHGSPPQVKILFRVCAKSQFEEERLEKKRKLRAIANQRKQREEIKEEKLIMESKVNQRKATQNKEHEKESEEDEEEEDEEEEEEEEGDSEEGDEEEFEEDSEESTVEENKPNTKEHLESKPKSEQNNGTSKAIESNKQMLLIQVLILLTLYHEVHHSSETSMYLNKQLLPKEVKPESLESLFRISVDIKCVTRVAFRIPHMYCKYTYPLFGSDSPVYTNPPIEVYPIPHKPQQNQSQTQDVEFPIGNGFCVFELSANPEFLYSMLSSVPLIIEVMDKARGTFDKKIGIITLDWNELLASPKNPMYGATLQVQDGWVPFHGLEDDSLKLGHFRVVLSLEDRGPVAPTETSYVAPAQPSSTGRKTPSISVELERWKEQEQIKWRSKLKQKEKQVVSALEQQQKQKMLAVEIEWKRRLETEEADWKQKIAQQESLIAQKHAECMKLEYTLKQMLSKLEKREHSLIAADNEMNVRRSKMESEFASKMNSLEDLSNRVRRELEHQKEVDRMRTAELERQKLDLEKKLKESENRYRELDKEYEAYRQRQQTTPDAKLQSEIISITSQNNILQKKLDNALRKKEQLKQQLNKCKEELTTLQQNVALEQQERVKKEQRELEALRMKYIAREQSELTKAERQDLENLKLELRALKLKEELNTMGISNSVPSLRFNNYVESATTSSNKHLQTDFPNNNNYVDSDTLERLLKEKENLLKTGFYNEDSKLIRDLNQTIEDVKHSKKRFDH